MPYGTLKKMWYFTPCGNFYPTDIMDRILLLSNSTEVAWGFKAIKTSMENINK
jgi:hypothetical protein